MYGTLEREFNALLLDFVSIIVSYKLESLYLLWRWMITCFKSLVRVVNCLLLAHNLPRFE